MLDWRLLTGAMLGMAACCLGISGSRAAEPKFSDLLDRARAEIAAGHRVEPPGDNLTDTIMTMFQLAPMATPEELRAFTDLLDQDRKAMQRSSPFPPAPERGAVPSGLTVPPPTIAPPAVAPAPLAANRPPVAPDAAPVLHDSAAAVALAAPVPHPPASLSSPATLSPASPPQTSGRSAELLSRGRAAEQNGDISGARRFFAAAAQLGNAVAARDLGRLYDPAYLRDATIGGIDPDASLARHWYQRAAELGDRDAAPLLQALNAR